MFTVTLSFRWERGDGEQKCNNSLQRQFVVTIFGLSCLSQWEGGVSIFLIRMDAEAVKWRRRFSIPVGLIER